MATDKKRLLIYAPVPLFRSEGSLFLEDQACNGLRLWAENFDHVTAMYPVETGEMPQSWRPIETVGKNMERINVIPLPTAYRPDQFLRNYKPIKTLIQAEIAKADYLSFSIGGLFGDWGSVSCYQAHKAGRAYGVWTDRVESEVVRRTAHAGHWRKRLRARLTHRPMAALEKYLIRRSTLGLFHGKETYDTYAPFCPNPQIVHDIHIHKSSHISPQALKAKTAGLSRPGPLKIAYVGRADPMKGPFEWLAVMRDLQKAGVDFKAVWLGDGPDLAQMREQVARDGLQDHVELPGFTDDREGVLNHLRDAHIFMFCHKTPESPRCLIEALVSGTPIVGYDGAFAADLISGDGGGILSDLGDVAQLTDNIVALDQDRARLAEMIAAAAQAGSHFDDESVFEHRSDLIRQHL